MQVGLAMVLGLVVQALGESGGRAMLKLNESLLCLVGSGIYIARTGIIRLCRLDRIKAVREGM